MKFEKAVVLVGKEQIDRVNVENYQLLIGQDYIAAKYIQRDGDYRQFLEDVATRFAEQILETDSNLQVGILNGFKINDSRTNGSRTTKIDRLDTRLFGAILANRISQLSTGRSAAIPAAEMN